MYLPCHNKQYNKLLNVKAEGNPGVTRSVHITGNRCPKFEKLELPIGLKTTDEVNYYNTSVS
jgi:hypothetical protein